MSKSYICALLAKSIAWLAIFSLSTNGMFPGAAQAQSNLRVDLAESIEALSGTSDPWVELFKDPTIDTSPDGLVNWVHSNTRLVSYAGVLRGPDGVLADGFANSADRAVLLAELLRLAGYSPVIAIGKSQRTFGINEYGGENYEEKGYESLRLVAKDAPGVLSREQEASHFAALKRAEAAVEAQVKFLENYVSANSTLASERSQDQWWVRIKVEGAVINLNPSGPVSDIPQPDRLLEIDGARPVIESLPDDVFHKLEIALFIDGLDANGKPTLAVPLRETIVPAKLRNAPVQLSIVPDREALAGVVGKGKEARAAFGAIKSWQPLLQIGSRVIQGERFGTAGTTLAAAATTGGGLGAVFTAVTDAITNPEGGVLTGVWVDYTIQSPGRTAVPVRRWLYDAIGPSRRAIGELGPSPRIDEPARVKRAEALSDMIRILPQVAWTDPVALRRGRVASISDALPALDAVAQGQLIEDGVLAPAITGGPQLLALARHEISPVRDAVYIGSINVLTEHTRLRFSEEGALIALRSMDIVANFVSALPGGRISEQKLRMTQGVADTLAETLVLADDNAVDNAAALLLIPGPNDPFWQRGDSAKIGDLPVDMHVLLDDAQERGFVVIAPSAPFMRAGKENLAWWRVDPVTGETLGLDRNGWGATSTEYILVTVAITICAAVMLTSAFLGFAKEWTAQTFDGICADANPSDGASYDDTGEADDQADDDDTPKEASEDSSGDKEGDQKDKADNSRKAAEASQPDDGGSTASDEAETASPDAEAANQAPASETGSGDTSRSAGITSGSTASNSSVPSGPKLRIVGTLIGAGGTEATPEPLKADPPEHKVPKALLEMDSIGGIASDGSDVPETDPAASNDGNSNSVKSALLFPDRYGEGSGPDKDADTPGVKLGISYGF